MWDMLIIRYLNSTCGKIEVLQFGHTRLSVYGNGGLKEQTDNNLFYCTLMRPKPVRDGAVLATATKLVRRYRQPRLQRHWSVRLPHPGDVRFSPSSHHTTFEKERPAGHITAARYSWRRTRQSLFSWLAAKELAGRTSPCKKKSGKSFDEGRNTTAFFAEQEKEKGGEFVRTGCFTLQLSEYDGEDDYIKMGSNLFQND